MSIVNTPGLSSVSAGHQISGEGITESKITWKKVMVVSLCLFILIGAIFVPMFIYSFGNRSIDQRQGEGHDSSLTPLCEENSCLELQLDEASPFSETDEIAELPKLPDEVATFFSFHESEVNDMLKQGSNADKWKVVGVGVSKITLSHPELPDYVIKIPKNSGSIWEQNEEGDIIAHYKNVQIARHLVEENHYTHIVVPDTYIVETSKGPIGVEKRFDCTQYHLVPSAPEKSLAITELSNFLQEGQFCDVNLSLNRNAQFLKNPEDNGFKIVVYDLDCNKAGFRGWGYF